jgi:hypothetical protein
MQDNTLQDIKDRLNITDVISGYISSVKKAGVMKWLLIDPSSGALLRMTPALSI